MAEALARKYGSDVLEVSSAGLTPQTNSHAYTRSVLKEKNVELGDHLPRGFRDRSQVRQKCPDEPAPVLV